MELDNNMAFFPIILPISIVYYIIKIVEKKDTMFALQG